VGQAYLNKTLAPLEVSQQRKRKFTRASKGPTFSDDFFTLCGFFNRHLAAALAFRSGSMTISQRRRAAPLELC